MGIIGPLIGCIPRSIKDKYGKWYCFLLLGKDNNKMLVVIAYNVPQETPVGDNTLHAQQIFVHLLDRKVDPNKKICIRDLLKIITTAIRDNQDIILMGDFNKTIGDNSKMMTKVVAAGRLIDVHNMPINMDTERIWQPTYKANDLWIIVLYL